MPEEPPLHSIQPSPDDPDSPRPAHRQVKEGGQRFSAERFRLPMRKRPVLGSWPILGPVVAILLVPCLWLFLPLLCYTPSMAYVVEAEYQELPPDDKALEQWLREQPDVYNSSVWRDGKRVHAVWGNSRRSYPDDVTPSLREEFERFGYKRLVGYNESKSYGDK